MAKVLEFPADKISKGVHSFTPEMGQRKPNCQMSARLSYYGNHYYVRTALELKGQGISLVDFTSENGKVIEHKYKVTCRAFEKLEKQYSISREALLD